VSAPRIKERCGVRFALSCPKSHILPVIYHATYYSLDYTAEEAKRLLSFNKSFEEFACGPDEITHPGDPSHYCFVHTLEEVLVTIRDHPEISPDFAIKIELKGPNTARPSVELVRKLNMGHRCHYSSFDHSRILEVRKLDGDAVTGALFDRLPGDFAERAVEAGASEVHLKYDTCTYEAIRSAHRAGLGTMAWFRGPRGMKQDSDDKYHDVGNEDVAMYLTVLKSGVGSMCVNRPDVMVKALAEARYESIRSLPEQ
jgi:glycerophosphoryl diester phosphodiesterase